MNLKLADEPERRSLTRRDLDIGSERSASETGAFVGYRGGTAVLSTKALLPEVWSARRWVGAVLLVFVLQLGAIFWLIDRTPVRVRQAASGPRLRLAGPGSAELLALEDPTLFALPHRLGFSG